MKNTPFLKHPVIVLLGAAIGVLIGLYNTQVSGFIGIDNFAQYLSFPGKLYILLLQMTVIPIVFTAISSGIGKLIQNKICCRLTSKFFGILILFMFICAITGMAAGIFGKPAGRLNLNLLSFLKDFLSAGQENEVVAVTLGSISDWYYKIANFFINLIPSNIFQALSLGSILAILFFSIVFGISIGYLPGETSSLLMNLCNAILQAFQKIFSSLLYLLPFALICLFAEQITAVDVNTFNIMSRFFILFCIGAAVIFVICTIIICSRSKIRNPFKVLAILLEPIMLSLSTRNSMATLPSAISSLENKMKFNTGTVNMTMPLGMALGRFGNIFYFALAVFLVGQIYNFSFEPIHYLIILAGVIFAGTATAGLPGIASLSMLGIVLNPLGLSTGAILIVLIIIDLVIDPFRTFITVYTNMAAVSLVAKNENDEKQHEEISTKEKLNEQRKLFAEESQRLEKFKETITPKYLYVYIQEFDHLPPLLYRHDGILDGIEIALLNEIGKRFEKR